MELHPFLEKDTSPNPGLWYVLSADGDCPSMRVGHTCSFIPPPSDSLSKGKIIVIGGANPSGPFCDTYILDLDNFAWDTIDHPGLKARYEHAMYIPSSQPNKIYIFAGADQGGNHNDIQVLDLTTKEWSTVTPAGGKAPSPRTFHSSASYRDCLYVYSGGHSGSDPVGDRQTHFFDASNHTWNVLPSRGDPPKPRHGHVMCAVENKIFVHGGMTGTTFYDDLHILDLDSNQWRSVKQKKVYPSARAAHGGMVVDDCIYIFGGMNRNGAMDDLYKLDTKTLKWELIQLNGPPPASRLDFACCPMKLRVPCQPSDLTNEIMNSSKQARDVLDQQLGRLGSGGSIRSSVSSAGSQRSERSATSAGSRDDTFSASANPHNSSLSPTSKAILPNASQQNGNLASESPNPVEDASGDSGDLTTEENSKVIDAILIIGGMDTEGEIFDDCLVFSV